MISFLPKPTDRSIIRYLYDIISQVTRPTESAYITVIDRYGKIASQFNASDSRDVEFRGNLISFNVYFDFNFNGKQFFQLKVGAGVGIGEQHGDCVESSQPGIWPVIVQGKD